MTTVLGPGEDRFGVLHCGKPVVFEPRSDNYRCQVCGNVIDMPLPNPGTPSVENPAAEPGIAPVVLSGDAFNAIGEAPAAVDAPVSENAEPAEG